MFKSSMNFLSWVYEKSTSFKTTLPFTSPSSIALGASGISAFSSISSNTRLAQANAF